MLGDGDTASPLGDRSDLLLLQMARIEDAHEHVECAPNVAASEPLKDARDVVLAVEQLQIHAFQKLSEH